MSVIATITKSAIMESANAGMVILVGSAARFVTRASVIAPVADMNKVKL